MENSEQAPAGEVASEPEETEDASTEEVQGDQDGEGSEPDDEAAATSEGDDEGESGEVSEVELNFGGEKLRVPEGAIPEEVVAKLGDFSKNLEAGYTKKFQDVADKAKSIEAREVAVQKLEGMHGEALQLYSRGMHLKSELEQLAAVDVNALWQSDPDRARRVGDLMAQKQREFDKVVHEVSQKEGELSQAQEAEMSRRRDEGKAILEKRVTGFTEKVPEVIEYAVGYGIPKEVAERDWALNPVTAEWAYKAMLYDKAQAATPSKLQKKPVKPVAPMKSKAGARGVKDVSTMSEREMAKHLGLPT